MINYTINSKMEKPKSKVHLEQLKMRCGKTNQVLLDVIEYAQELEKYVNEIEKYEKQNQ